MAPMNTFNRGDFVFDVVDAGPAGGVPLVLLHGFPQTAAVWGAVAGRLHDRGYRTVAPDQRGYSPRARPKRTRDYRLTELVGDVVALVDELDAGAVHVVGHDLGGVVAWMLAAWHPDKVRTLTAVSAPHPDAFVRSALRSRQALASWYIPFFQLPGPAQWALDPSKPAGRRRFTRLLEHSGAETADAERDAARLGRDGLRSALAWYRAALPSLLPPVRSGRSVVAAPTLVVGSDRDRTVLPHTLEMSLRYVAGPARLQILTGVTHWIPDQAPDQLAALIADHVDQR